MNFIVQLVKEFLKAILIIENNIFFIRMRKLLKTSKGFLCTGLYVFHKMYLGKFICARVRSCENYVETVCNGQTPSRICIRQEI